MLAGTPILVEVSRGDDRAAVRRDMDGFLWISHWHAATPQRVAGTRLEGLEPAQVQGSGWSAIGGRLPDGAVSAEVRGDDGWRSAHIGGGAWVAFISYDVDAPGLPAVRFLDSGGALVSRAARDASAAARPLTEMQLELLALGPLGVGGDCPACGAVQWRAARAGPGSGERVFCAVCGHTDGSVIGF